jgi:hypothetical protein
MELSRPAAYRHNSFASAEGARAGSGTEVYRHRPHKRLFDASFSLLPEGS